jgi:hypothetical protein
MKGREIKDELVASLPIRVEKIRQILTGDTDISFQ